MEAVGLVLGDGVAEEGGIPLLGLVEAGMSGTG
jgi:hypothetical protein